MHYDSLSLVQHFLKKGRFILFKKLSYCSLSWLIRPQVVAIPRITRVALARILQPRLKETPLATPGRVEAGADAQAEETVATVPAKEDRAGRQCPMLRHSKGPRKDCKATSTTVCPLLTPIVTPTLRTRFRSLSGVPTLSGMIWPHPWTRRLTVCSR